METIFSLLRKKQVAPFFFVVTLVSTIAFAWACKINYQTTYSQLSKVAPKEAAIMFTLAIQSFEFLVPVIAVLGITKALKVSKEVELGLNIAWFVVIAVDFITAFQYFIGVYDNPGVFAYLLSVVLSGVFLVAELLLVISLVAMYVVYKMWATGRVPAWVTDPEMDTVQTSSESSSEPAPVSITTPITSPSRPVELSPVLIATIDEAQPINRADQHRLAYLRRQAGS